MFNPLFLSLSTNFCSTRVFFLAQFFLLVSFMCVRLPTWAFFFALLSFAISNGLPFFPALLMSRCFGQLFIALSLTIIMFAPKLYYILAGAGGTRVKYSTGSHKATDPQVKHRDAHKGIKLPVHVIDLCSLFSSPSALQMIHSASEVHCVLRLFIL